jgi:type VI secretion system protein
MIRALLPPLALALLLGGCSLVPDWINGMSISHMTIVTEAGANQNTAIAVDLVMLSDKEAAGAILKLSAREWFDRRAGFERDYPDGVKVQSWEIVPGQALRDADVDSPSGMKAAVIFALYDSDGPHRLRLGDDSDVHLTLGADDVKLSP